MLVINTQPIIILSCVPLPWFSIGFATISSERRYNTKIINNTYLLILKYIFSIIMNMNLTFPLLDFSLFCWNQLCFSIICHPRILLVWIILKSEFRLMKKLNRKTVILYYEVTSNARTFFTAFHLSINYMYLSVATHLFI